MCSERSSCLKVTLREACCSSTLGTHCQGWGQVDRRDERRILWGPSVGPGVGHSSTGSMQESGTVIPLLSGGRSRLGCAGSHQR